MDLIYANNEFMDIGVLQDYTLDMAYGIDENDFEIKMALHKPECEAGHFIYFEDTEYGGVIDSIGADTNDNLLTYKGRTWNGILACRVIEPDAGEGYYVVSGEANGIVNDIIDRCDLLGIFDVEDEDSGVIIDSFSFRYDDVNTGLFCMLQEYDAKLMIRVHDGKAFLHVEPLMNYATDEFDSSQQRFSIMQTFAHCNHLICLGQGLKENRYVIHLFTDDAGGLQPYFINGIDAPIKDSQYILDKSQQLITGQDEYTQVYDYSDAEITENYEVLTEKPDDWDASYDKYYEIPETDEPADEDSGDNYTQLERQIEDVYSLTTSQPTDWTTNYTDYFTKDGSGNYEQVEPDSDAAFDILTSSPSNWKKTYNNYYIKVRANKYKRVEKIPRYNPISKRPKDWDKSYRNYYLSDGAGGWNPVSGEIKTKYEITTQKPSTWAIDWGNYYVKYKENGKVKYRELSEDPYYSKLTKAPKWKKNTFYIDKSYTKAPEFNSQITYYSKKMVVPAFVANTYYAKNTTYYKTWTANTYYKLYPNQDIGIEFVAGQYFKQVLDHYAELVAGGIDRLKELNNIDELTIDLKEKDIEKQLSIDESGIIYNIGDIVGGTEHITGVFTAQPITKKIINIEKDVVTIQHEVR